MVNEHAQSTAVGVVESQEPVQAHFLLTNEAARVIGVAAQTIRLWERLGRLRAIKTERGVRLFDRRDVERLAREREERRSGSAAAVDADITSGTTPAVARSRGAA